MALCGNGVVEEGEECDCGWEEDCLEDCCWPQRTSHPSHEKPCTLKPKRDCSPSQGPCCTNSCTFISGEKCLDDNGCREESFCDGTSSSCPLSQVRPNKTVCNKEFVCYKGECTGKDWNWGFGAAAKARPTSILQTWTGKFRIFTLSKFRNFGHF